MATIRVKAGRYRVLRGTLHHAIHGEVRQGSEVDLSYEDAALALQANVVEYVGESAPESPPEAHRLAVEARRQRDEDALHAPPPPSQPEAQRLTKAQRKAAARAPAGGTTEPAAAPKLASPEPGLDAADAAS